MEIGRTAVSVHWLGIHYRGGAVGGGYSGSGWCYIVN